MRPMRKHSRFGKRGLDNFPYPLVYFSASPMRLKSGERHG